MDLEEIKLSDQASHKRADTLGFHLHKAPRVLRSPGRESRRRFPAAGWGGTQCSTGTVCFAR